MMYLNCSRKNDVLFFVLYTGTHGWSQVHLIPILIATLNKKRLFSLVLSDFRLEIKR